jgi:murein DD-endopeptidase MepM/ murein hydrolase activator NlpD
MRKLYYFSKTNQKLIQIEYLNKKSILIYISIVVFLLGILWGVLKTVDQFTSTSKSLSALENENNFLHKKLNILSNKYLEIDKEIDKLRTENNSLRIVANLPPVSLEEAYLGIGGKEYESPANFLTSSTNNLNDLNNVVEKLTLKLKFEKNEHLLISERLKENEVLFASIPAIKPCNGVIGQNGFGMREHPILGINRMHEGIDIITDVGTKVSSPGEGKVSFIGLRGGYGLTLEIEHASGYKTVYAHLSRVLVKQDKRVRRGSVIALTGNSGLSTGPHLHYEVHHEGIKLDPTQFFFDDLVLFDQKSKN